MKRNVFIEKSMYLDTLSFLGNLKNEYESNENNIDKKVLLEEAKKSTERLSIMKTEKIIFFKNLEFVQK